MTNTNAATLTPAEVQQARDLSRAGFTTRSIAAAFNVCARTIADILKGRSWWHLADVPGPLPMLQDEQATRLKLRGRRVTSTKGKLIDKHRKAMAIKYDHEATLEGSAIGRLRAYTDTSLHEQEAQEATGA